MFKGESLERIGKGLERTIEDTKNLRNMALAGMIASTGETAFQNGTNNDLFFVSAIIFALAAAGFQIKSNLEKIDK